MATTDSSSAFR